VVGALAAHQGTRQLAQVWQDQAEEPIFDASITCAPNAKQLRDITRR